MEQPELAVWHLLYGVQAVILSLGGGVEQYLLGVNQHAFHCIEGVVDDLEKTLELHKKVTVTTHETGTSRCSKPVSTKELKTRVLQKTVIFRNMKKRK